MDYIKLYNDIIHNAMSLNRSRDDDIYYEEHHITPKCINGTNDANNKVLLTAKEHLICHMLLVQIYPDNTKIYWAYHMMCYYKINGRDYKISAREYEWLRIHMPDPWNKNKKGLYHHTEEHKQNMKGRNNPFFKHGNYVGTIEERKFNNKVDRIIHPKVLLKKLKKSDEEIIEHNIESRKHINECVSKSQKGRVKSKEEGLKQSMTKMYIRVIHPKVSLHSSKTYEELFNSYHSWSSVHNWVLAVSASMRKHLNPK